MPWIVIPFSHFVVLSVEMMIYDLYRSETKLEPWDEQREKIAKASASTSWKSKTRKAFWRGNPDVGSPLRMELLKCNNASGWYASRSEIQNQVLLSVNTYCLHLMLALFVFTRFMCLTPTKQFFVAKCDLQSNIM